MPKFIIQRKHLLPVYRSATRPRLVSTRYAIFWNVKKEIPRGSKMFCNRKSVFSKVLAVSIRKSVYLK